MPYVKEVCYAGDSVETRKYFSSRYKSEKWDRQKSKKPTTEEMERVNEQNAERKLMRLLRCNFKRNDWYLTFTYRKDERPETVEKAKDNLKKLKRKLRALYKKNKTELKYIFVTEYENKAIHHHAVVNYLDMREIQKVWPYGTIKPKLLYTEDGYFKKLAEYLIKETKRTFKKKETVSRKRWESSRNLEKPKIVKKIISANSWREKVREKKGYKIIDQYNGFHEFTGCPYQEYTMVRRE